MVGDKAHMHAGGVLTQASPAVLDGANTAVPVQLQLQLQVGVQATATPGGGIAVVPTATHSALLPPTVTYANSSANANIGANGHAHGASSNANATYSLPVLNLAKVTREDVGTGKPTVALSHGASLSARADGDRGHGLPQPRGSRTSRGSAGSGGLVGSRGGSREAPGRTQPRSSRDALPVGSLLSSGPNSARGAGGGRVVAQQRSAADASASAAELQRPQGAPPSSNTLPTTLRRSGSGGGGRSQVSGGSGRSSRRDTPGSAPMTPAMALRSHAGSLTEFEQSEILEFPQVWYLGAGASKHRASPEAGSNNHGYDDDRGDYRVVTHDHLAYRYEVLGMLGRGSFGQVAKCYDYRKGCLCAIKVIRNKTRFHAQALIEVKILERLRGKDGEDDANVVHMREAFYFRGHLCISFELLSINLYDFIKNNNFAGLSAGLIRRIAAQLLVGLKFLRKQRIIHCDLKPENILLRHPSRSGIKIVDFGSSCYEDERVYTYIQSRFYRSPEVILGLTYNVAIDMWSLGCILAELYTGYPLFPGENEQEQLACIMEVMGVPPRELVAASTRRKMFFDSQLEPRQVTNSRGRRRRPGAKDLASALRCSDTLFLDFLQGCLRWDSRERMTPEEAMEHEWMEGLAQGAAHGKASTAARSKPPAHAPHSSSRDVTGGSGSSTGSGTRQPASLAATQRGSRSHRGEPSGRRYGTQRHSSLVGVGARSFHATTRHRVARLNGALAASSERHAGHGHGGGVGAGVPRTSRSKVIGSSHTRRRADKENAGVGVEQPNTAPHGAHRKNRSNRAALTGAASGAPTYRAAGGGGGALYSSFANAALFPPISHPATRRLSRGARTDR